MERHSDNELSLKHNGEEEAVHHRRYTFGYLVEDGQYFLR
jgi:hypothetical protein